MEVIATSALTKVYGQKYAVNQLDMTVQQGDIYGFIGRNGSGKSTTLKMLSGLAHPTTGEIRLFGQAATTQATRRRVGVLVESAGLYPGLSAYENMMLKAACMGLVKPEQNVRSLLELVGLDPTDQKRAGRFSMGMKQRLGVGLALLGGPDLLLLDEPINGLDPEGIQEVRNLLLKLNQEQGITLVISSHILGELSKIATRYGILKDGRMVQQLSNEELAAQCQDYLHLQVGDAKAAVVVLEQQLGLLKYQIRPQGEVRIFDKADPARVNAVLAKADIPVQALYLHGQDLEGYFLDLMGGEMILSISLYAFFSRIFELCSIL